MKIICDCGNEMEFNTIDEETGKQAEIYEEEGQYATVEHDKFGFWSAHDELGVICKKCKKAIWIFT